MNLRNYILPLFLVIPSDALAATNTNAAVSVVAERLGKDGFGDVGFDNYIINPKIVSNAPIRGYVQEYDLLMQKSGFAVSTNSGVRVWVQKEKSSLSKEEFNRREYLDKFISGFFNTKR